MRRRAALIESKFLRTQALLTVVTLLAAGCGGGGRSSIDTKPEGGVPGLWDENGTIAGYQEMVERYGRVLENAPNDLTAITESAYAYCRMGSLKRLGAQYDLRARWNDIGRPAKESDPLFAIAEKFVERARTIDATKDVVLAADSILQRTRERNPEAAVLARKAYGSGSSNPRVLEAYEIVLIRTDEIRDLYKRIISLAPKNAYYWDQLGIYETDAGLKRAAWQEALSLSPNYALPRIYLASTEWPFSGERATELETAASAAPQLASFADYTKTLGRFDAAGYVLIFLLSTAIVFRLKAAFWICAAALYAIARLAFLFFPAIGDTSLVLVQTESSLSGALGIAQYVLFLDAIRSWFSPQICEGLLVPIRRVARGMVAPYRQLAGIPLDQPKFDNTYYFAFAQLLVLELFVQQVFARLARWW